MAGSQILQALIEFKEKYAEDKSLMRQADTPAPRPGSDASAEGTFDPLEEFTRLSGVERKDW